MSQDASNLCIYLVNDAYGELTGLVYEALCSTGRASSLLLQRLTRLSPRQVKHALAVLVQQNLVFWYTPKLEEPTVYEANLLSAHNLVRGGKYLQITEERFGTLAKGIVSRLMLLGHAQIGELIDTYQSDHAVHPAPNAGSGTRPTSNGTHGNAGKEKQVFEEHVSLQDIRRTTGDLLQSGLISFVHESNFRSYADNETELDKIVPSIEAYKAKSIRERAALREIKLREQRSEWIFGTRGNQREINILRAGLKRPTDRDDAEGDRKRLKLDSSVKAGYANIDRDNDTSVPAGGVQIDNRSVRINHEKFALMMRNDALVNVVGQRIGTSTSKVYRCVLRMLEYRLRACKEDMRADANDETYDFALPSKVSTETISAAFADKAEFIGALGRVEEDHTLRDHPKKDRRKESRTIHAHTHGTSNGELERHEADAVEDSFQNESDQTQSVHDMNNGVVLNGESKLVEPVRQHLLLLSTHPDQFLEQIPSTDTSPEQWTVDYTRLATMLANSMLFQTISNRFGTSSSRLARICHEKGRLDDKSLCTLSLLPQKELRARLFEMQKAGLLEQQEVPRDNARIASRTSFLYHFEVTRCKAKTLENCDKTMLRCLQRLDVEKEKVSSVLEKIERSDVKGREDDLLSDREKEGLRRWNHVEDSIWGEIGRIDEIVAIIRDF